MPVNSPIRLKVSRRVDFFLPVGVLYLLVVFAALMSPYPLIMTLMALLVFAARWLAPLLKCPEANNTKLTSVIFPDGRVQLESVQGRLNAGILNGQQWCTRHLAVLRITDGDTCRSLVILSNQQQDLGDFRRLNMWLRQDLCNNTDAGPN